eukprot:TRINITY_DN8721_c0_g1_i1.p1 TRINITY_DN8721_c0_g1~~TRINITY_DN8721_c0_g1_i1.p1  ORF type:complete len:177 (-),score=45.98 TRINITY_DN8721_c0_g1_i1:56-586(-)
MLTRLATFTLAPVTQGKSYRSQKAQLRKRYYQKSFLRFQEEEKKEQKNEKLPGERPPAQLFNEELLDSDGEPLGFVKVTGDALKEKQTRASRRTPALGTLEEHPILSGHFGTPENPVIVPSVFDSRQIGCFGDPTTRTHPIRYHTVHREKPLVCLDCGQVFKLETPEGEQREHRGH